MPEAHSFETVRAAVEAIIPGDGTLPSGPSLGVDRHVCELGERYLTGFVDVIAALLDAYVTDSPGTAFKDLDMNGRRNALKAMAGDESVDIRDAADALFAFTYGGMYSEWTGFDGARRVLAPPAAWAAIGFHGPALGHPDFDGPSPPPHPEIREVGP